MTDPIESIHEIEDYEFPIEFMDCCKKAWLTNEIKGVKFVSGPFFYCPDCGRNIRSNKTCCQVSLNRGANFCPECGEDLSSFKVKAIKGNNPCHTTVA